MRRILLYTVGIGLFYTLFSCTEDLRVEKFEQFAMEPESELLTVLSPRGGDCLDSMRTAFQNAMDVADFMAITDVDKYFRFLKNPKNNYVVHMLMNDLPYIVWVSEKLIREYTWNGYLLIALHEFYHALHAAGMNNEDGHMKMATDPVFHRWIQLTFKCKVEITRYLAYVGMENTLAYENLPQEDKDKVQYYAKMYNIKKY